MAKKKNNNNNENRDTTNENNTDEGEKKKEGGDAEKKKKEGGDTEKKTDEKGSITVVLKVDMHCEGCASKIVKCARAFEGVETVKIETSANKLTLVGAVDPSKIRDKLSQKTKKKVDLVSPQPKKDKDKETKEENNKNNVNDKKPKEKEAPVTTVVLKLNLHCQGCIERIQKTALKTKGVIEVSVDEQKDLVTVKGTMDMKALTDNLKEKLKKPVEIVPTKKEKEEKESSSGDNNKGSKKKKGGGGGEGGGNGGGDGDGKGDGGGKGGQEAEGGRKMEGNRMNNMMGIPGPSYGYEYRYPMYGGYEYGYPVGGFHAPQMFSDENPNACAVM